MSSYPSTSTPSGTAFDLSRVKPLTTDQYDAARAKALERVKQRIGTKPQRRDFERELGHLWTALDVIAVLVFGAALIVSSLHIIAHMGKLADASYSATAQAQAGTVISRDLFVAAHQWMLIPLAEGSMILFLVMFGMTAKSWRRWVYFVLALIAVVFVIVANWQSGIGVLESLLPPAFTIGIGLKLEALIVEGLKRRDTVTARYLEALHTWETSSQDASKHPDFLPILKQELWQKLVSLKANQDFKDAPPPLKAAAVYREMQRDLWAYETPTGLDDQTPQEMQPVPLSVTPPVMTSTNGNGTHQKPRSGRPGSGQ